MHMRLNLFDCLDPRTDGHYESTDSLLVSVHISVTVRIIKELCKAQSVATATLTVENTMPLMHINLGNI